MGYIGDPQATSDVITEDGWLKSGDIGYINHVSYYYYSNIINLMFTCIGRLFVHYW